MIVCEKCKHLRQNYTDPLCACVTEEEKEKIRVEERIRCAMIVLKHSGQAIPQFGFFEGLAQKILTRGS
jgi:hypothetical protein